MNTVWTPAKSTFAGDYVLAVCSKLIARTNNQVSKFYWLKSKKTPLEPLLAIKDALWGGWVVNMLFQAKKIHLVTT